MNRTLLLLIPVLATAGIPTAGAQQSDPATVARQVCASCHGPAGQSISSAFPRLAGQQPDYINAQLKAFRDRKRGDPMAQAYMWGMASQLDDATIKGLAAYYARQKPVHGHAADPKLAQQGQAIFENGLPAAGVPACASCHGQDAAGKDGYPRLAGQHAEYLVKQLSLFKNELRAGAQAPLMHEVTAGLSFDQMTAVSAYLASK